MKHWLILFFTIINMSSFSQSITVDVFNNLEHTSKKSNYRAFFKKDVFDDYEFTDTNKNKLYFNKKYILANFPFIYKNEDTKISFFKSLIRQHKQEYNLKVSHEIDIFGNETINDNRGNKTEISTDIFETKTYKTKSKDYLYKLKKRSNGNMEYSINKFKATLEEGFKGEWIYKDNTDNEFSFSKKTWKQLLNKHQTPENIFMFLLYEFTQQ